MYNCGNVLRGGGGKTIPRGVKAPLVATKESEACSPMKRLEVSYVSCGISAIKLNDGPIQPVELL